MKIKKKSLILCCLILVLLLLASTTAILATSYKCGCRKHRQLNFTLFTNSKGEQRNTGDTHAINIRSAAFESNFIKSINLEVDITFEHPEELQGNTISYYDGREITGNSLGKSTDIFANDSTTKTVSVRSL